MTESINKVSESDNKKWVPSVYTKLYRSIFDGSLYGQFEPLTTFMAMLALANQHGEVDASPERIAGSLGCKLEFVLRGIESLEAPDKRSRTPDEDGRRIIRLLNEDGQPRPFGWRIVNYAKYRAIRSEEERRAYKRQWDRANRSRNPTNPTPSDRVRPETTYTEVEGEATKSIRSKAPAPSALARFPEFWNLYPRKVAKTAALKAWRKVKPEQVDAVLKALKAFQFDADPKFQPHPATWLNQGRWEDQAVSYGTCKFCDKPATRMTKGIPHCETPRHIDHAEGRT